ncbi:hypothetical protein [Agromyces salentinus]|uniref:Uncharacterized protein n=1 Tax=Agromyces salentinus TaxID=269421 RepID=A0ABN2N4W9_9MICO|nr:hypothetical protein [Agromyces salentinus]
MRWPWQRVAVEDGVDAKGTDGAGRSEEPRISPAGWAFLPPMQRQISDAPPATLRPGWIESLPTRTVPSRVAELTHLVDDAAPSGTVATASAALGAPVQRSAVADLTLRPPQTAAERARERQVAQRQRQVVQPTAAQQAAVVQREANEPELPVQRSDAAGPSEEPGLELPDLGAEETASPTPPPMPGEAVAAVTDASPVPAASVPDAAATAVSGQDAAGTALGAGLGDGLGARPPHAGSSPSTPLNLAAVQRTPDAAHPETPVAPDAVGSPDGADVPTPHAPDAPTISAAPPLGGDPGRLGLAAPVSGARAASDSSSPPAAGGTSVQRSTSAPDTGGMRRIGLGAPLPPGIRSEPRHTLGGTWAASGEPAATGGSVEPPASVQRSEESARSGPRPDASATSPGPGTTSSAALLDTSAPAEHDGPDPYVASVDQGGMHERPVGLADPVAESSARPGTPLDWAVPTALALQRSMAGGGEPAGSDSGAEATAGGAAEGSGQGAAAAPTDDGRVPSPGAEPLPPLHTVPLIAQRALETSLDATAMPPVAPSHPRAIPVVAFEPFPTTSSSSSPGSTGSTGGPSSALGRAAGLASVQRSDVADSGSPSTADPRAAGASGGAQTPSAAASGGVFAWVQRVFGRNEATAAMTATASDGSGDRGDGADHGADHRGDLGANADLTPWSTSAPAGVAHAPLARAAGPLTVSRLTDAATSAAPSGWLNQGAATLTQPQHAPGPMLVQRSVPTIAGPAASAPRLPLPVASPPAARADGGAAGAGWANDAGPDSGSPSGPVVQTAIAPGAPPPDGPGSVSPPADGGTASVAASAGAAAPGAAGIDTSPAGIESLAARLYGPLARRLKAELLLDRERRGIRIDGI